MANHPNHAALTDAALAVQSTGFLAALEPERSALIDTYCMYGDLVVSGPEKDRARIALYMDLPDGSRAQMGPSSVDEMEVVRIFRRQYRYWFERIADAVAAGDMSAAAQFLGVVSHSLGDTAALPHALGNLGLDMRFIRRLFPTDSPHGYRSLHNFLENLPTEFSIAGHEPRLLGTTWDEAAFNAAESVALLINNTLAKFEPALKATYRDDVPQAQLLAGEAYADGARVLADVMHTSWCIGRQEFHPQDLTALSGQETHLGERVPSSCSAWVPYPYFFKQIHRSPVSCDMDMNPVPLALTAEDGGVKRYDEGLALGVRAHVEYDIPAGVYATFAARVGLNPELPNTTPVRLAVSLDGKVLSERVYTDVADADDLVFDMGGGGLLRISTEPAADIDVFGRIPCHVVVAGPRLRRLTDSF